MSQHDSRTNAPQVSDWVESDMPAGELDLVRLSAARARGMDEFARTAGDRDYLKQVVDNAVQQTERVCAMIKQIGGAFEGTAAEPDGKVGWEARARDPKDVGRAPSAMVVPEFRQKPLTRREREVLNLISQGYSNKQGALQMRISPRTFESHRAEAMRKLGARNTADLVRAALLHPID